MRKYLRIFKNKIREAFKRRSVRIASGSVATAAIATVVIASLMGADGEGDNTIATVETKDYIEIIVEQMEAVNNDDDLTNDRDFTILEIVPYVGMGEFVHYVHHDEVTDGIARLMEDSGETWFQTYAAYKFEKYAGLNNFAYDIMYRTNEEEYFVRSGEYFLKYVLPEYAFALRNHLKVNVCEANDLTIEEINEADMIIVQTGTHDQQTVGSYHDWADVTDIEVFLKDGTDAYSVTNGQASASITYDMYEDISDIIGTAAAEKYADREKYTVNVSDEKDKEETRVLISRDLSWVAAEELMEVSLVGRTFMVDGKEMKLRTPVIMDNQTYGTLASTYSDSNIYKYITLERLIGPVEEGYKATYADIKEGFVFDYDNLDNNEKNQLGVATAKLQFKNSDNCSVYWPMDKRDYIGAEGIYNYYTDFYVGNPDYYENGNVNGYSLFSSTYNHATNGAGKIYQMFSPNNSIVMTDNYWIHEGGKCLIPSNIEDQYWCKEANGFTADRIGDTTNVTVVNIMRYLLGTTPDKAKETIEGDPIRILEIEPTNQFKYDRFEYDTTGYGNMDGVKVLAESMGYDTALWSESNYTDYIDVTCVSTDTFNSLNEDLIATYDIIYFGMEYEKVLTVSGDKTIYNDSDLNGYVYLAYGDIIKTTNALSGLLVNDYGVVGDPSYISTQGYTQVIADENGKVTDGERNQWGNVYDPHRLYPASTSKWNDYLKSALTPGLYYVLRDIDNEFMPYGYYATNSTEEFYNNQLGNARLDGNDITEKKYDELVEYMEAEKVFLMDDEIFYNNTGKIYATSNSAKIINKISMFNYDNGFSLDNSYMIPHAIKKVMPEISFTEKPVEIEYNENGLVSKTNPDQNVDEVGYQLRYIFDLTGEAGATYNIKLVLDKDGDGLYDAVAREDDSNEMYYEIKSLTLDGTGIAKDVRIEATLPTELTGPVAWQIQVTKLVSGEETVIREIETGYTAVMGVTKNARVLQIYSTRTLYTDLCTLNMATNENFQRLLNAAAGAINFNITVEAKTTMEFEAEYRTNPNYRLIDNYDMVVLGFADIYDLDDISNDYGALDDLMNFIESGGSTLFAHDMTSFITTPNYVTGTKQENGIVYAQTKAEYNNTYDFPYEEISNEKGKGHATVKEISKTYTGNILSYYEFTNRVALNIDVESAEGSIYSYPDPTTGETVSAVVDDATASDVIYAIKNFATNNENVNLPRREYYTGNVNRLYYLEEDLAKGVEISPADAGATLLATPVNGEVYYWMQTQFIENNYNKLLLAVDVTDIYEEYKENIAAVCGTTYQFDDRIFVFVKHKKIAVEVDLVNEYTYRYRYDYVYVPKAKDNGGVPFGSIWTYNITKTFRNTLGMDKFGATLAETDREAQNKTKPYYIPSKAMPYTDRAADGNYYVDEIQGFTDLFLLRFSHAPLVDYEQWGINTIKPYQGFTFVRSKDNKDTQDYGLTTKVSKINEGQITQYPYAIPDDLTVSPTHAQNYALDLEKDVNGDDIVVWYTLEDSGFADETNYYKYTVKDGALNYYIYSKGNITYSGAGHSAIAGDDEMKLFVNTIIRAITAGNTAPTVAVDNGNKANDGSYVVYRDEFEEEYVILFTPKDTDLLSGVGKFTKGSITYVNKETGAKEVIATYGDGELICGKQYEIKITDQGIIDAIALKKAEFYIEVADSYGAAGTTKVVFSTRHFFELD